MLVLCAPEILYNAHVHKHACMYAGVTATMLLIFIATLFAMGRIPLCECGLGMWSGAWDSSTSQQMADPYSFSHILHGIIVFWALWILRKKISLGTRFLIALLLEMGWEILENTPLIINRYRANTASLDYFGDSVLNSFFDVVFAMFGFWLASKFSWKWSLAFFVMIELVLLYLIRDNLTLNVLMLLYPIPSIRAWQVLGQ